MLKMGATRRTKRDNRLQLRPSDGFCTPGRLQASETHETNDIAALDTRIKEWPNTSKRRDGVELVGVGAPATAKNRCCVHSCQSRARGVVENNQ